MFYIPHSRVTFDCGDKLITKQSHKAECDIHNILKQYQRTGIITHVAKARPTFTDLPDNIDYQTAMNTIIEAQDAFALLPAKVRDHFGNDPARFLGAFSDPKQADTLREFGLLKPVQPPLGGQAPTLPANDATASGGAPSPAPALAK
jgi:phage internal scaffolding protein